MSKPIIRKFIWGNKHIPKRIRILDFEVHQNLEVVQNIEDLKLEKSFFFLVSKRAESPIDRTLELQITFEGGKMLGAKFIIAGTIYKILLRVQTEITESLKEQEAFWDLFSSTSTFFRTLQLYSGVKNKEEKDGE